MGNMSEMEAINPVRQPPAAVLQQLTPRQFDVLLLLCEGMPNKQIGRQLNIASATVKIHVANILRTLNVASRLQAVVVAISLGLEKQSGNAQANQREAVAAPRNAVVLRLVPMLWEKGGRDAIGGATNSFVATAPQEDKRH